MVGEPGDDNPQQTGSSPTVPIQWVSEGDAELMGRVQGGDERALEVLMHRHAGPLGRFFYRLTGDPEAVDDLLQETFIRIFVARKNWQPTGNFRTWIHTIARRLVIDRSRRRKRKPLHRAVQQMGPPGGTTTLLGKIPDNSPTPFSKISNMELMVQVDLALQGLPLIFREAVVMCDMQRLSYEEAAEVAGCSVKTLSTRLARGREKLREVLMPYWKGPGSKG